MHIGSVTWPTLTSSAWSAPSPPGPPGPPRAKGPSPCSRAFWVVAPRCGSGLPASQRPPCCRMLWACSIRPEWDDFTRTHTHTGREEAVNTTTTTTESRGPAAAGVSDSCPRQPACGPLASGGRGHVSLVHFRLRETLRDQKDETDRQTLQTERPFRAFRAFRAVIPIRP